MANAELQVLNTIEHVASVEWDELCAGRPFVDHRWLRFVERAQPTLQPRYVLLRRAGRLEGAAVCSIDRQFDNPTLQRRVGWLLRHTPCVRCSVPIASESGLVIRPGADEARLLPVLLSRIRRLAVSERALFTAVGHVLPGAPTWAALQAAGFAELSRWRGTSLSIGWSSFDDYLASRPGDDRREIARMRRRAEREHISVVHRRLLADELPQVWKLVQNVQQRHAARDVYAADVLGHAADVLGEDLHVLEARRSGERVGCAVMLRSGDELLAKWIGLDYERSWNTATYYMLIAESVARAIELGVRHLRLGATAYATKQQFGVLTEERVNAVIMPAPLRLLANVARAA
jgi:predicted N-acyltransferase